MKNECRTLLLLINDLLKLNKLISQVIDEFKTLLIHNPSEPVAWLCLAEATLGCVVLFNKRRSGQKKQIRPNNPPQNLKNL